MHLTQRKTFAYALLTVAVATCRPARAPLEGSWRAVLESPGGELPFMLRFERGSAVIVNGAERVPVSGVSVDGSQVTIRFDWYDSAIRATLSGDGKAMTGQWTRTVPAGTARLPFRATRGEQPRFSPVPKTAASLADVTGIWKVEFVDSDGTSPARGEFHQERSRVTGTFLTPTGDHRYLEGSYEGGLLRLSTFDGAHAFLRPQQDEALAFFRKHLKP